MDTRKRYEKYLEICAELEGTILASKYISQGNQGAQLAGTRDGHEVDFRPDELYFQEYARNYLILLRQLFLTREPYTIYEIRNRLLKADKDKSFLSHEDSQFIKGVKQVLSRLEVSSISSEKMKGRRTINLWRGQNSLEFLELLYNSSIAHRDIAKQEKLSVEKGYGTPKLEQFTLFNAYRAICQIHPVLIDVAKIVRQHLNNISLA